MPNPSFRVSDELYQRLKAQAQKESVTVSDILRTSVRRYLDPPSDSDSHPSIAILHDELSTKNAQIDQLHQLVAMAQSNASDTLKQLEDSRARRRWWFWRRRPRES
ncbi:hypothetical protein IH992_03680 [Candidatus Poribacteria bacterium]|nr:hypothetical protein [Candidatus Poribacteria bacterium]